MKPLVKDPLDRQAADAIRSSILNGHHPPGAPLREVDLADTLGISRATIRTALRDLTHEGIVETTPNRGSRVRDLTSQDAWEIYTLRNALEALAAELLATTITNRHIDKVNEAYRRLERAVAGNHIDRVLRADLDLHTTIVELTGHRLLSDAYQRIRHQTQLYLVHARPHIGPVENYVELHHPLVQAITSGNPQLARQLAYSHNTPDGQAIERQLDSGLWTGARKRVAPTHK